MNHTADIESNPETAIVKRAGYVDTVDMAVNIFAVASIKLKYSYLVHN